MLIALAIWMATVDAQLTAPRQLDAAYRLSISGTPIARGELWLFYYGWGYTERRPLGEIRDGHVRVTLSQESVRDMTQAPSLEGAFVALHVPDLGWYRSRDFDGVVQAAEAGVLDLGKAATQDQSERGVDLPKPVEQTIHVQNVDGSPRPGQVIQIEPYVSTQNHCGVHTGLDWGSPAGIPVPESTTDARREITTDRNGVARFVAPLTPLYLGTAFYVEDTRNGRRTLTLEQGEHLDRAVDHVLRHVWARAPQRKFVVRLRGADGRPAPGGLIAAELANACGPWFGPAVATSSNGDVSIDLAPEHVDWIRVVSPSEDQAIELNDADKDRLFRTGELTVTCPWSD